MITDGRKAPGAATAHQPGTASLPRAKPLLRGVFHQQASFAALAAGLMLVASARGAAAKTACIAYSISLTSLLAISATYHRGDWKPATRAWLRRLDHASIFALIAGTYTPLCALAMPDPSAARTLLSLVWGGAGAGIAQMLLWPGAPRALTTAIYIALGWTVLPYARSLSLPLPAGALLVAGGLAYSIGGAIYAARCPDPWPAHFGYHEVFHALVVIAAVLQFAAISLVVQARA